MLHLPRGGDELRDWVTRLLKMSHEANLEPAIDRLQFTAVCIVLGMTDEERRSINQMLQGQAIFVDNVLAF